jgi:hypothetical protein
MKRSAGNWRFGASGVLHPDRSRRDGKSITFVAATPAPARRPSRSHVRGNARGKDIFPEKKHNLKTKSKRQKFTPPESINKKIVFLH